MIIDNFANAKILLTIVHRAKIKAKIDEYTETDMFVVTDYKSEVIDCQIWQVYRLINDNLNIAYEKLYMDDDENAKIVHIIYNNHQYKIKADYDVNSSIEITAQAIWIDKDD